MSRRRSTNEIPLSREQRRLQREAATAYEASRRSLAGESGFASLWGERLRRVSLGLTAALLVARAYWPSVPDLRVDGGTGLDWSLAVLLVAGLAAAAGVLSGRLRGRFAWADVALVAMALMVGWSASVALDRRAAINLSWEWGAVAILYVLARNLPRTRGESWALTGALCATAVAVAAYGLYQVTVELPVMQADYRLHAARVLAQLNIAPGSPEQKMFEDRLLNSNEPIATFALANSLAGFLLGPLVVALGVLLGNMAQKQGNDGRARAVALLLPPTLLVLVTLVLTKSRSAWVGLAFGTAVLAWQARGMVSKRVLAATVVGFAALVVAVTGVGLATGRLDAQVLTQSTMSMRYRWEYWVGTWRAIRGSNQAMWRGFGPGNFGAAYVKYKLPQASEEVADPHNMVLEVWSTAGLAAAAELLLAVGLGLWDVLGRRKFDPAAEPGEASMPAVPEVDRRVAAAASESKAPGSGQPERKRPAAGAPPLRATWLVLSAGLGWALAVVCGWVDLFKEGDLFTRWLLLGVAWTGAAALGQAAWRRVSPDGRWVGAAVLATAVSLLAAGGIGHSSVASMFWVLLALGLNLRDDRPCGRLNDFGGRVRAFIVAMVWAALIGTFAGSVLPYWKAEGLIAEAERAADPRRSDLEHARALYTAAISADPLTSRPWLGLADIELRAWLARGAKSTDEGWRAVLLALEKAVSAPRNEDSWTLHSRRAGYARMIRDRMSGDPSPSESLRLRAEIIKSTRKAALLYPNNALLHAALADADEEIGMRNDARMEAVEAIRLDDLMPHPDKKLPSELREHLKTLTGSR